MTPADSHGLRLRWDKTATASRDVVLAPTVALKPSPARPDRGVLAADLLRRHGRAALVFATLALFGAATGFVAAPVGAVAEAELRLGSLPPALIEDELSRLHSAALPAGMLRDLGAERLLLCNLRTLPLALMPAACLLSTPPGIRAESLAHSAIQVSQTDAGNVRLSVRHADPLTAASMLQSALNTDAALRRNLAQAHPAPPPPADPAELRQRIAVLDHQIATLKAASPGLDPGQDLALLVAQMSGLDSLANDLLQRQQALTAQLDAARAMLRTTPPQLTETDSSARTDPPPLAASQELLKLQLERTHMQANYAPGFQGLVELDRKIALAEAALRQQMPSKASSQHSRPNPVYQSVAASIATLTPSAEAITAQLQEVRRQQAALATREVGLRETVTKLASLTAERGTQAARLTVARDPTLEIQAATARAAQDLAALHFVPNTMALPWPDATRPAFSAIGALLGLCTGAGLARSRAKAGADGVGPVGRIPALERLAVLDLPFGSATQPHALVDRLLRGQRLIAPGIGAPPLTLHLIGTQPRDGAVEISQILAPALVAARATGALVAQFGRPGTEMLQSFRLREAGNPQGGIAQSVQQVMSTGSIVTGLIGAEQRQDLAMMLQLRRLRDDHGVLIMVSNSMDGRDLELPPGVQADLTVLVLHTKTLPSPGLARLRATLERLGQRPSFYIATHEPLIGQ